MSAIRLEDLHFSYPPRLADGQPVEVLRGLTLHAPAGQALAIMGPTSSGKTALALLLAGLAPEMTGGQVRGQAWVAGLDPVKTAPARLSHTVGLVFQEPERQLFNMTVAEEVAFGLEGRAVPPQQIGERVKWALASVGLTGLEQRAPWQLSGGQQKRLAIASILTMQPPLLILDEPMAGLDPAGRREVAALLTDLKRTTGATVIVTEKDAEFVARWAERVVVLAGGQIALDGAPGDLFQQTERLHGLGVAVPQMAELAALLRADGERAAFLTAHAGAAWVAERLRLVQHPPTFQAEAWPAPATSAPPPSAGRPAASAVVVDQVSFAYPGGAPALAGISLAVEPGEFVALVGPNGGGKSTLARHINGLLRPQRGAVALLGQPSAGRPVGELARTVGYVFQNPDHQIFAPTVREEVAFGPRNLGLAGQALAQRVAEALAAFDLTTLAEAPPAVLGYGLRRLVTLASVWAMQPPIWLLDEPTTGLDARLTGLLMARLHALHGSGHTVLLITHDLKLAAGAQRIVGISQGRVVIDGPPQSVFADSASLEAIGLRPPPITRLSGLLTDVGFPHPLLRVEQFMESWRVMRGDQERLIMID
ncbi:MAG TPA: energy-coupling factor transporter ATPase [Anaerolineae bacterium]|nr:energy-coupling factor transporter ATPase [Anaerolineae bacterium]